MKKKYTKREVIEQINFSREQIDGITNGNVHELIKKMTIPYQNRIEQIEHLCNVNSFRLNFIGNVGIGKSTALCHLMDFTNFESGDIVSKKSTELCILKTASGRTTLCETSIIVTEKSNIEVEVEEIENSEFDKYISDFCDQIIALNTDQVLPQELMNVIYNMSGFPMKLTKDEIDYANNECKDKVKLKEMKNNILIKKRIDFIGSVNDEKIENINKNNLKSALLTKIDRENRNVKTYTVENNENTKKSLKDIFEKINSGQMEKCPIPKSIKIKIPRESNIFRTPKYISEIIDSKGLDGKAVRNDIQTLLAEDDNLIILCNGIADFGNVFENDWINSILIHKKDLRHRCFLMGLEKLNELSEVNNCEGDRIQGIELKQTELENKYSQLLSNIKFKENNILFYNALRGIKYNSDYIIENFDKDDYYSEKEDVIGAIENSVEDMYDELYHELKELRRALSIFEQNTISKELKDKLYRVKNDVRTHLDEIGETYGNKISVLPNRIELINAGVVRGSVNRNGIYYNCNIYSECSQIGSEAFTEICSNRIYSLSRSLTHEGIFNSENEMEVAISEALLYKIEQEYSAFEMQARNDYYKVTESKIYNSGIWEEARRYWGDGKGNYRSRVIDSIMSDFRVNNIEAELSKYVHSKNLFETLYNFIDNVTK